VVSRRRSTSLKEFNTRERRKQRGRRRRRRRRRSKTEMVEQEMDKAGTTAPVGEVPEDANQRKCLIVPSLIVVGIRF
jgi:hypothetical protein